MYWRNHLAEEFRVGLRIGDWKIIGNDDLTTFELYNIAKDPQETTNLAAEEPERFTELRQRLIDHDATVLKDGPDWWKDDTKQPAGRPGRGKTNEPAAGKDETGDFDTVLGTKVNGAAFSCQLPDNLKKIRYVGLYNKATATDFSAPVVEAGR